MFLFVKITILLLKKNKSFSIVEAIFVDWVLEVQQKFNPERASKNE